jgi:hypothetical protein
VNWSLSPSLMSGQVDAVVGAFRNFELNQMDINGAKGKCFYIEEEGLPAYDELIYVAKPRHHGQGQDCPVPGCDGACHPVHHQPPGRQLEDFLRHFEGAAGRAQYPGLEGHTATLCAASGGGRCRPVQAHGAVSEGLRPDKSVNPVSKIVVDVTAGE